MVGRYFSVTVGKDLYGQSEGGSCLGMLQGCVEHEVCGEDMKEENTCFFWLAYDADPRGGWLRRETAGGRHSDTSKIVAGVRAAGGVVEAH